MDISLKVPFGQPGPWHRLEFLNWEAGWPYKPEVAFRIWHSGDVLHLEYKVDEQSVRAVETHDGNDVYKDSCVEFFFQPLTDDPHYYNFEFNAAGTMVVSWRTGRMDPEHASPEVLASVKRAVALDAEPVPEPVEGPAFAPSVEGSRVGFEERPAKGPWALKADIPVSALKPYFGHTMGAAGVLETIICAMQVTKSTSYIGSPYVIKMLSGFGGS